MNSTVKVDVGGKRGYKVRTKIKNKDFVSIMQEYTVDNDGITFRAETYLDNEATVRISFASQTVYRVELYPFHHMEVRKNPVFEFPVFREFQVSEDE